MTYEEGLASIVDGPSFLNPLSRFPRDMSVSILSCFTGKKTLLDSTAATGIRGIRYAKELGFEDVTFLDINEEANKSVIKNMEVNGVTGNALNQSIQHFANTSEMRFDIIDLDPFGSPVPNLYDLMKVSRDGTLLLISATDTAVLCGAQPRACIKLYGSVPLHDELCHESGIRILVAHAAKVAAQFNFGIEVVFSFFYRHMVRIAILLRHGAAAADFSIDKIGYAYHCKQCRNVDTRKGPFTDSNKCSFCGGNYVVGGGMWIGNLYDPEVKLKSIDYFKRAGFPDSGICDIISGEIDLPFFYSLPVLTRIAHLPSVSPRVVVELLKGEGFLASLTHMEKESVKTNADMATLLSTIRRASVR